MHLWLDFRLWVQMSAAMLVLVWCYSTVYSMAYNVCMQDKTIQHTYIIQMLNRLSAILEIVFKFRNLELTAQNACKFATTIILLVKQAQSTAKPASTCRSIQITALWHLNPLIFRPRWVPGSLHQHKAREEAWRIFQLGGMGSSQSCRWDAQPRRCNFTFHLDSHLCELPSVCCPCTRGFMTERGQLSHWCRCGECHCWLENILLPARNITSA